MYTSDRMSFITDYMSAYKAKIELLNEKGLFDAAKMFELFALEICKLYFKQNFYNLNTTKLNFPIFDLISEDEAIYVQVSTEKYIPSKIKKTLKKLNDSKEQKLQKLNNAYFFMLDNSSVRKVKDLTGTSQIGNISFIRTKNLITTRDIINRAETDMQFQEGFYKLIKNEFENFNENATKLISEIENSKNVGLKNIETLINNEYEIDRNDIVSKIKSENKKFISIQGREGSGKSALCKKIVENEEIVLYARAERFVESKHLEEIWNLDINKILELINGKKIVFFIDALEFIADSPKIQLDLFETLYSIVKKYENSYIVTSCRTSDKNAFLKLESNYSIQTYNIDDINEEELNKIKNKYPIIKTISKNKSYSELLKTPFYINLIISKSIDVENINDINEFRKYIWEYIICLKEKCKDYKVSYNRVIEQINKIAFDRAKYFSLGTNIENIDNGILQILNTEGIIVNNKSGVRLKYDIYEDICFEMYFDNQFKQCKGEYLNFYQNIESMGRCVYRRYQIWISNKLFIKESKDKFLYKLIFSNGISDEWKKQTEIGIVKSEYCQNFFDDYEREILENNLLKEFIEVINMFSFDSKIIYIKDKFPMLQLKPIGNGRTCVIKILYNNLIFKEENTDFRKIIKLCSDYTLQNNIKNEVANYTCDILQYYVDLKIDDYDTNYYKIIDDIDMCLIGIYRLSKYSNEWIKKFFEKLSNDLLGNNQKQKRVARDLINWTLKNSHFNMLKFCAKDFCVLLNNYWLENCNDNDEHRYGYRYEFSNDYKYGLSQQMDNYNYEFRKVTDNLFLNNLYYANFNHGFEWTIDFINKCVEKYYQNHSDEILKIQIKFKDNDIREYYGNPNMWVAGIIEHSVPTLIADMVYCLRNFILKHLEAYKEDTELFKDFSEYIKNNIYSKSNNIILLTIIESVGMTFESELPGYAIDLATSIEIVNWDTSRYTLYLKNTTLDSLKQQMLLAVGLLNLEERYKLTEKCNMHIQSYVANSQIYFGDEIRLRAYDIIDYLYSKFNNDEEDSMNYLQIQKMDLRNAKVTKKNDNTFMLEAQITGEAEKIVEKQKKLHEPENELYKEILEYKNNNGSTYELVKIVDKLLKMCSDENMNITYESLLIASIAAALNKEDLTSEKRNEYCLVWIGGINKIFENDTFNSEISLFPILLNQLSKSISIDVSNDIKNLMLKIILNEEHNGIIYKYAIYLKQYLFQNKKIAKLIFNTIIQLAYDEMQHQKYNANYIEKTKSEDDFVFVPNMQPKLYGVDKYIENVGHDNYISQKDNIIQKYLYCEEELKINSFEINDYDISTLCYISNCGLDYDDEYFINIMEEILNCIIKINNKSDHAYEIINSYNQREIIDHFEREIIKSNSNWEKSINLLFDKIDFSEFSHDNIELYEDIFGGFSCEFYDSYVEKSRRINCKKKIKYIEDKINNISNLVIKKLLFKILFFSINRYHRWNVDKYKTSYDYNDKKFLNNQLVKYGKYYPKEVIYTLYQLNIDELLPEILISVDSILSETALDNNKLIKELNGDSEQIINMIIVKAFVYHSDKIKEDKELLEAYEKLLKRLIELNYANACIILDEFRIH